MSAAASVVALCVLMGVLAAQVDQTEVRDGVWNTSLAAALSLARYTGRPVLIFFWEDWCGYCEELEKVLVHLEVQEATKRFILVRVEPDTNDALVRKYRVETHHTLVMLDWSGTVIDKVTEVHSAKEVALKVIEAAVSNELNAAEKLFELGYFGRAAERLHFVEKMTRSEPALAKAKEGLERIAERAKRQLDLVRQLIRNGRTEEAVDACVEFITDYPPDMGRDEAEKLLMAVKSGRPVKLPADDVAVKEVEPRPDPEVEAKVLLDKGMVHEWQKRFYDAVSCYRTLIRDYGETVSAAEARRRIDLLLKEPGMEMLITKQKMDAFCRRVLEIGQLYEKNGRDDEALKQYQAIVKVYPDSSWAARARMFITDIERRRTSRGR